MPTTFSIFYSTDDFTDRLKLTVDLDALDPVAARTVYLTTGTSVTKNEVASGVNTTNFWVVNDSAYTCIVETDAGDTGFSFIVNMVDLVLSNSIGFTNNATVRVNRSAFVAVPTITGYYKTGSTIEKHENMTITVDGSFHRVNFTGLAELTEYSLFGFATYTITDGSYVDVFYTSRLSSIITESTTVTPNPVGNFSSTLIASDSYYFTHDLTDASANGVLLSWTPPNNLTSQTRTYTIALDGSGIYTEVDSTPFKTTLTYEDTSSKISGTTYQYSITCTITGDDGDYSSDPVYSFIKFYTKPEILTVTSVVSTVDTVPRTVYPIAGTYYVEEDSEITVSLSEEQTGGYTLDHIYVGNTGHTGTSGDAGHTGHDVISEENTNVDTFASITGTKPYFYTIQEEGPTGYTGTGPQSGFTGSVYDSPELNVLFKTFGALDNLNMSVVIPTVDYTNTGATGSTATVTWDYLPSCGLDQTIVYTLNIKSDTGCYGTYSPQGYVEQTYTYTGSTGSTYSLYPEDCYLFTLTATEVGPTGPAVTTSDNVNEYANRSSTMATDFTIEYKDLGPTYNAGTGPLCASNIAVNYDAFTLLEYSADIPAYPGMNSTYSLNKNEVDVEAIVLPVIDGIYGSTGATGSTDASGNFKITSVNDYIDGEATAIITKDSYTLPSVTGLTASFSVSGSNTILNIAYTQSSAANVHTELFIDDVFETMDSSTYVKTYLSSDLTADTTYVIKARSYIVVEGKGYIGATESVNVVYTKSVDLVLTATHTYTSDSVTLDAAGTMNGYVFVSYLLQRKNLDSSGSAYADTTLQFPNTTTATITDTLPAVYGNYRYKCTMTYTDPNTSDSATTSSEVDIHYYDTPLVVGTPSLSNGDTVNAVFNPRGARITSYVIFAYPVNQSDVDELSLLTHIVTGSTEDVTNYTITKTYTFTITDYTIIIVNEGGLTVTEYTVV